MIKGLRIQLIPNNKQRTLLAKSAGVSRWAYNRCIAKQMENYREGKPFLSDNVLRAEITQMKKTLEYAWLGEVSAQIPKQAIKDGCHAFKRFFKGLSNHPRFKRKRDPENKFYHAYDKLKVKDDKVKLERIGWIRLAEKDRIPEGCKFHNPRIVFDGVRWWLTVGIDIDKNQDNTEPTQPIGIDLGLHTLAVCSNGMTFSKPDITKEIRKLKRLQKRASRYYEARKKKKQPGAKSRRMIKLEIAIRKVHQRIANVLTNNIHQMTFALTDLNPQALVIEDLNVKGMLKNRHLADSVRQAQFGKIRTQLEYKCERKGITLIVADRFYPSSKKCSSCGATKHHLKLSERTFTCSECGISIDRDYNASLNLQALAI